MVEMLRIPYYVKVKQGFESRVKEDLGHGAERRLPGFAVEIRDKRTDSLLHSWEGYFYKFSEEGHILLTKEGLFGRIHSWNWVVTDTHILINEDAFIPPPIAKRVGRLERKLALLEGGVFPGWYKPLVLGVVLFEKKENTNDFKSDEATCPEEDF